MDILKIKELCRTEQIEFSRHVSDRMFQLECFSVTSLLMKL